MIVAAALAAVVCFALAFARFGVVAAARRAVAAGVSAARTMRDPHVSEAEKERSAQTASMTLFGSFLSIVARTVAALAVSVLPPAFLHVTGVADLRAVQHFLLSAPGLALGAAAVLAATIGTARR